MWFSGIACVLFVLMVSKPYDIVFVIVLVILT